MSDIDKFLKELDSDILNRPVFDNVIGHIKTPSPSVNWALNGGIVPGRFYVITGPEGSGKSMFCASLMKQMLLKNEDSVIIWFDTERSFSDHWVYVFLKGDKVISNKIRVRETQKPQQIFDYFSNELCDMMDRGLKISACVVDSVQQMIGPKEENRATSDKATMSDLASYLPGAIRQISEFSRKFKVPWFFISQVRDNFENAGKQYIRKEDKYSITGGRAFKHGADVVFLLEAAGGKTNSIYDEKRRNMDDKPLKIGHLIKGYVLKNRLGPSYRKAEFMFNYEKGIIETEKELGKLALKLGIVKLDGKTYVLGQEKLGVGQNVYFDLIKKDNNIYNKILSEIEATYSKELDNDEK